MLIIPILIQVYVVYAQQSKRIWIDCDPGDNDALSLIYSMFHNSIKIIGISTTYGQQSLDQSTDNAVRILGNMNGFQTPLVKGLNESLSQSCSKHTQGNGYGMYNADVFDVNFMPIMSMDTRKQLQIQVKHRAAEQNFTLVLLGPHTNFATTLNASTELFKYITEIVMVATDGEECDINVNNDPIATELLLKLAKQYNIRVIIIPRTLGLLVNQKNLDIIKSIDTKLGNWVHGMLSNFNSHNTKLYEILGIFYITNPNRFKLQQVDITILDNQICQGMSTFKDSDDSNVMLVNEINYDKLWELLAYALQMASKVALIK